MRHSILLAALLAMLSLNAFATKLTITVQDFSFSPSDATIRLGDTIMFLRASGSHTTTSTIVPSGAAAWDSPLDAVQQTFIYVPTVVGNYEYLCTPHASMGMTGRFTVQNPTSVPTIENSVLFSFWPNPAGSFTHVKFNSAQSNVSLFVTDIAGNTLIDYKYTNLVETDVDISNLPEGRYILYATNGNEIFSQHLVVR